MLQNIADGKEQSNSILIKDSVGQNGRGLLKTLTKQLSTRVDQVHMFCFDSHAAERKQEQMPTDFHYHDCRSDPLGWDGCKDGFKLHEDFIKYSTESVRKVKDRKILIVLDSLSPLLRHRVTPYTCQVVTKLKDPHTFSAENVQVMALLHEDLHDEPTSRLIEHVFSTVMTVLPPDRTNCFAVCDILHKKLSGKVIKSKERFSISQHFDIQDVEDVKMLVNQRPADAASAALQSDPAANLTFNLSLTDAEKEARSRLTLPYMHDDKTKHGILHKGTTVHSKIFYQPDEADDFDEEDPDDDLDI